MVKRKLGDVASVKVLCEFFKDYKNSRSPKDACYLKSLKNSHVCFDVNITDGTFPCDNGF